jgi:hypothetical protein
MRAVAAFNGSLVSINRTDLRTLSDRLVGIRQKVRIQSHQIGERSKSIPVGAVALLEITG